MRSFLNGYDALAHRITRIATYPLLLMPNTDYHAKREEHGFVTVRGDDDDFEYVLEHRDLSVQDNLWMHSFLFWARLLAENPVLRGFWTATQRVAGMKQSDTLLSIADWARHRRGGQDIWGRLSLLSEGLLDAGRLASGLRLVHGEVGAPELLLQWWDEGPAEQLSRDVSATVREALRFDIVTLPRVGPALTQREKDPSWVPVPGGGVLRDQTFDFDVAAWISSLKGRTEAPSPRPVAYDLFFRSGLEAYIDNHEESVRYVGQVRDLRPARVGERGQRWPALGQSSKLRAAGRP